MYARASKPKGATHDVWIKSGKAPTSECEPLFNSNTAVKLVFNKHSSTVGGTLVGSNCNDFNCFQPFSDAVMSEPDQESESNDFHNAIPEVEAAASLTKRQRNRRRCKVRAGFSKVPLRNRNDSQISEGGKGIFKFEVDTQIF